MYKICILSIYLGKFPLYFNLWLDSCARNSTIDFLIITDQNISNYTHKIPDNVKVRISNLDELHFRFENSLKMKVALDRAYKLCDLKPMYGIVFQDEFQSYDFWGHCDIDLIWGDLRKFMSEEILSSYDKIFPLGHLSLYRNTSRINELFKLSGSWRGDYTKVIATNKSCVFDERYGINKIFEYNNQPIFLKEIAADIDFRNQRMIIAGTQNKNYKHQIFFFRDGKCMRAYEENGVIKYDEFAYLHLQKRRYLTTIPYSDYFIVAQNEFIPFPEKISVAMFNRYNPFKGFFYEWLEYRYKDYKFRISRRLKQLFIK